MAAAPDITINVSVTEHGKTVELIPGRELTDAEWQRAGAAAIGAVQEHEAARQQAKVDAAAEVPPSE